jgi:hypothetical protein
MAVGRDALAVNLSARVCYGDEGSSGESSLSVSTAGPTYASLAERRVLVAEDWTRIPAAPTASDHRVEASAR